MYYYLPYVAGAIGIALLLQTITKKKGGENEPDNDLHGRSGSGGGLDGEQHRAGERDHRKRVKIAGAKAKGAARGMQKLKKELEEERRKRNELQRDVDSLRGEPRNNHGGQHDPAPGNGQTVNEGGGEDE
jgi:hypothetical protein